MSPTMQLIAAFLLVVLAKSIYMIGSSLQIYLPRVTSTL